MTNKNPDQDEVYSGSFESLSKAEEQELFRTAIPVTAPELSPEDIEILESDKTEKPRPESKHELDLNKLLGTPSKADISASPFKYGGRIFFTNANGINSSCSAQFIGEHNILLTAAHCIRDDVSGNFFTNFRFYRGYDNRSYEKEFSINAWGTKSGWVSSSNSRYRYDYAFLRTTQRSDVGYLGYKTLQNDDDWIEFGYPVNFGNNLIMQKVSGTRGRLSNGTVEMLGNPMRRGNSGGAWFVTNNSNNRQAMGNQSHNIAGNTDDAWGPIFTNSTFSLLRAVRDR